MVTRKSTASDIKAQKIAVKALIKAQGALLDAVLVCGLEKMALYRSAAKVISALTNAIEQGGQEFKVVPAARDFDDES